MHSHLSRWLHPRMLERAGCRRASGTAKRLPSLAGLALPSAAFVPQGVSGRQEPGGAVVIEQCVRYAAGFSQVFVPTAGHVSHDLLLCRPHSPLVSGLPEVQAAASLGRREKSPKKPFSLGGLLQRKQAKPADQDEAGAGLKHSQYQNTVLGNPSPSAVPLRVVSGSNMLEQMRKQTLTAAVKLTEGDDEF